MKKVRFQKRLGMLLLSCILVLSLTGCLQTAETSSGSPPNLTLQPAPTGPESTDIPYHGAGTKPPEENRSFTSLGWVSSEDGRGFYIPGEQKLHYYDLETRRLTSLCAQSGCMHVDETCGAWLGEWVRGFAVYDGYWYALSSENGGAVLRQIDPQTRDKRVLCAFYSEQDYEYYEFTGGYVSHGYAYLWLNHSWSEGTEQPREYNLVRVNLSDGSAEPLTLTGNITFAGSDGDSVLLLAQFFTFDPMSEEEFLAKNPDGNYENYLLEEMERAEAEGTTELREYTFDMSDYRMVAEGDVWISPTQALTRYGDYSLYAVGDTLHIYDLTTGESREIQAPGELINFLIVDGTAIYLVRDPELKVYATALAGGESYLLEDRAGHSVVAFGISGECADAFYGIYTDTEPSTHGWILKEDYYAGNYDQIVATD